MAMIATTNRNDEMVFHVIHPLFDEPEEKIDVKSLGPMKMTGSVRYSLLALRVYLIMMVVLAFYRVISVAGLFGV